MTMLKYLWIAAVLMAACSPNKEERTADPVPMRGIIETQTNPGTLTEEEDSIAQSLPVPQKNIASSYRIGVMPEESFCSVKGTIADQTLAQKFLISTDRDTLITLKEGIKIFIPEKAFQTRDSVSTVPEKVNLCVNAFTEVDEFMQAGLNTVTVKQELLETGGSLYMTATTGGNDTCNMQPDKNLQVAFPIKGPAKKGMGLYRGEENEDGFVEWNLDRELSTMDSSLQQRLLGTRYEQFQDGSISLEEYFAENLYISPVNDPVTATDHVYINFDIIEEGKIANVHVQGTEDALLSNKIANTTRFMPQWKPFKVETGRTPTGIVTYRDMTMGISVALAIDRKLGKVILDEKNDTKASGIAKYITMEEYYVFTPRPELGWLNCDRLFGVGRPLARVFVERDTSSKTGVVLVCRDLRGIMKGVKQKAGYRFNGLPEGEYVYIVSVRKSNNKYLLEIEPYICGRGPVGEKQWQWYSREEMIKKLRSLWTT